MRQNEPHLAELLGFLPCRTPTAWCEYASQHLELLLIDHAHCEKKAASTALSMIYRYADKPALLQRLSRLAREELRHFEQVLKLIQQRGYQFKNFSPSRYAGGLHELVRTVEPYRLLDSLIIGAFIEARSCERFASLIPYLDAELAKFYQSLLASEARHFRIYLDFASEFSEVDLTARIVEFAALEKRLIESEDQQFRFHSGVPTHRQSGESSDEAIREAD